MELRITWGTSKNSRGAIQNIEKNGKTSFEKKKKKWKAKDNSSL